MNRTRWLTVGLALVVLTGGMAAVGAASPPADTPNEEGGQGPALGPSDGLPSPVPDFVSDILGTIGSFLSGGVDSLGEALSGQLSVVSDEVDSPATEPGVIDQIDTEGVL